MGRCFCEGSGVLAVPKHKITALEIFPMPQTKKGLRSFLGVISYYRKSVSGIANFTALLTPSTNKAAPAWVPWTREMEVSFSEFKYSCTVAVKIKFPQRSGKVV